MQVRQRDVIAIADAGFGGVGRHHAMAGIVEQQSGQQMVGLRSVSWFGGSTGR